MPDDDHACCGVFDTTPWDETTHVWQDKPFIKETLPVFFHIPWPPSIGRLVWRMWNKAVEADAAPDKNEVLLMSTDPSPWRSEWYMSVNKEVPDAENVTISGTFFTKVFDGPYSAAPKWIKQMDKQLAQEGKKAKNYYFHYLNFRRFQAAHAARFR